MNIGGYRIDLPYEIILNGGGTYAILLKNGIKVDQGDSDEIYERLLDIFGVPIEQDDDRFNEFYEGR